MARKRTSDKDLVVSSAAAGAVPRRKPTTTTRKHSVKPADPSPQAASVPPATAQAPTHEQIAQLAYTYWTARGYQGGSPEEDWLRAEQELSLIAVVTE
jgi:hypothetical protein